jgi:hypothetical protein
MAARLRPHLPAAAGALLGLAVLAWLGLYGFAWNDYDFEAAPAFKALLDGHLQQFLAQSPAYGGSMVLRAPFAAVPGLWGGGELAVYRAGAVPCLLATGSLAVYLAARARAAGLPLGARATAIALCVASPIALRALEIGHPEELLGAVFCVGAVLAGTRDRTAAAGVLLGLAIATKPWALVAVGPVAVALGARAWRGVAVAAIVTLAVMAPLVAAHPRGFGATTAGMATTGTIFQPWQAWWFTGDHGKVVRGGNGHIKLGYRAAPAWINSVSHPLIVLAAAGLTALFWRVRRRRGAGATDALLLLVLLLHLRCVLDTWNTEYYALPLLLALVAWETIARRRVAVLSLLVTAVSWVVFEQMPLWGVSPDGQSLAYLALALPAAAALAVAVYAPRTWVQNGARRLTVTRRTADVPA